MKTKTILTALLLMLAVGVSADRWVGNSAISVNGTWYYAGNTSMTWCTGGAFNEQNLGNLTSLSIGGQSQVYTGNDWGQGTMTMGYKIDNGEPQTLTLTYYKYENNNNFLQSGGADFSASIIDISNLSIGTHIISVWFVSEDATDNNGENYYVANFTKPYNGAGTEANPYEISSKDDFDKLATLVNDGQDCSGIYFKMTQDISYDGYGDYVPVGTLEHPFNGTFDGKGFIVIGPQVLSFDENDNTIHDFAKEYVGLFGYVGSNGVVKNVKVEDPYMLGGNFTGGIVGYNLGLIDNCRIDNQRGVLYGESEIQSQAVRHTYGGIAGYNGGMIQNCVSATKVMSYINTEWVRNKIGGIVGHNAVDGTVQNCLYLGYNLLGENLQDRTNTYVGAIAGHNEGTLTGNLYHNNQYRSNGLSRYDNIGTIVKGVGIETGVTGEDVEGAKEAKCVFFKDNYSSRIRSEQINVSGNYTETEDNPDDQSLRAYSNGIMFDDDNFPVNSNDYEEKGKVFYTTASSITLSCDLNVEGYEVVYEIADYDEGTSLNGSTLTLGTSDVTVTASMNRVPSANSWLADGIRAESFSTTDTNSITIMNAAELGLLAYNVNFGSENYEGYTITLGANEIDLNAHTWEPIGYGLSSGMGGGGASGFLGTFDGGTTSIKNMKVTGGYFVGLFSNVQSGVTVKNVNLSSPQVKGENYVGAIAGMCSGTIENCHVAQGTVEFVEAAESGMTVYPGGGSEPQEGLGGIAGMLSGGTIKGCTFIGVSANIYPFLSNVEGVGGIVGGMMQGMNIDYVNHTMTYVPATLKDCLFAGNIFKKEGNSNVGAIAGLNNQDSPYGGESIPNNIFINNYYVDGGSPLENVTLNTELFGVDGADVDGARLAIASVVMPTNIGAAGTQYDWSGVRPYANGLYYNQKYYLSSTAPAAMNITLSNDGDNTSLLNTYSGMTGTVTLGGRTFYKDGTWNTICLPFTINDVNDSPLCAERETVELYQLTNSADGYDDTGYYEDSHVLTLNFENCKDPDDDSDPDNVVIGVTTLVAGRPYLIRWKKANGILENPVFENVTIEETSPEDDNTFGNNGVITFIGTFAKRTFETEDRSILFLGGGNTLYWPQPSGENIPSIGAFRAYFQLNGITAGDPDDTQSPVRSFKLNFGDETSSIVNGEWVMDNRAGAWYSLDGRKLSGKPTKAGLYIVNGKKVNVK